MVPWNVGVAGSGPFVTMSEQVQTRPVTVARPETMTVGSKAQVLTARRQLAKAGCITMPPLVDLSGLEASSGVFREQIQPTERNASSRIVPSVTRQTTRATGPREQASQSANQR